jgi:hypothetical protein
MLRLSLLFTILSIHLYAQEIFWISVMEGERSQSVPSYNYQGTIYVSVKHLADALGINYVASQKDRTLEVLFPDVTVRYTANTPFIMITSKVSGKLTSNQMPTSAHFVNNFVFVPLNETLALFNLYGEKSLVIVSPGRIIVLPEGQLELNSIQNISMNDNEKGTYLSVIGSLKINAELKQETEDSFILIIKKASTFEKPFPDLTSTKYIKYVAVSNANGNVEIRIKKKPGNIIAESFFADNKTELVIHFFTREDSPFLVRESEHFRVIYREYHSYMVNNILRSAEQAFDPISKLFNYTPTDKIIIATYDVSDYGYAATSTTPQNFIRFEIEPLEPGYEVVPYNERIQWLLSHEIVHIIVNDAQGGIESFFRKIFGKVPPEKTQPITVLYSLLTNYSRFTPRWYQEAIAVFFETWLNSGYGRVLGSFDEMYFRTLVKKGKKFAMSMDLETDLSNNSIFLEEIFYLYGARFVTYLSIVYGYDKMLDWFRTKEGEAYSGFEGKFRKIFGKDFSEAWKDFISYETDFQKKNINLIEQSEQTQLKKVSNENYGWVSKPLLDKKNNSVIYVYHRPGELTSLQSLGLKSGVSKKFTSVETPSLIQVSSVAFDNSNGLLFYTTNNNQFFRDIWSYDVKTDDEKMIFEDFRVGDLSVSPITHDLWGVQHDGGLVTLVYSQYPYNKIFPIAKLPLGEEIFNLSVDDEGKKLAATLKMSDGQQSIVVIQIEKLLKENSFQYQLISASGSPENPSWSNDGKILYWNAYTNGVSNIYRYNFADSSFKAITNCVTGLFRPLEISPDSIFAFEFTSDGFVPVIFANKPAKFLPAINYLGQKVIEENPQLYSWNLKSDLTSVNPADFSLEKSYNGLGNLHINSFIPVVSGFQNQVVFGLLTRISDPILIHDFYIEAGISPLNEKPSNPLWHFRFKYDYKQIFYIDVLYNGADFFDLFNDRKRGLNGTQLILGHTYWWKYDNPKKIKQTTTLAFYRNVEYLIDNIVQVSQPDFAVLTTEFNAKNLRKSIGSTDYEFGNELNWTVTLFGTQFDQTQVTVNSYAEFSNYSAWLWNHNTFHVKFAGGFCRKDENLVQSLFYIGGFGNRGVDNDEVKQYRRIFRFPGIPIYSLVTDKFGKILLENDLPPVRPSGWLLFDQFVNTFDFAIYSQGLITKSDLGNYLIDIGAQMDINLKHWYNLESTFSAGIAKAWSWSGYNDWEWFLSIKLLKD